MIKIATERARGALDTVRQWLKVKLLLPLTKIVQPNSPVRSSLTTCRSNKLFFAGICSTRAKLAVQLHSSRGIRAEM